MDEAITRAWCETLARGLERQKIPRNGRPYLDRYFVAGWSPYTKQPGPAIFLHHFHASDPGSELHSHPWEMAISLILVGGYHEERCDGDGARTSRVYQPGDVNTLKPDDLHRIDLLGSDCWSLFIAGAFDRAWRFVPDCESNTIERKT